MRMTLTAHSPKETEALAAAIARRCRAGDCIALSGDLGAGKTTFARGFIRALQAEAEEVVSPTFTLVQSYATGRGFTVWHFDLYRLRDASDLLPIGFKEALESGVTLVEWPEMAKHTLPPQALHVAMEYDDAGETRRIALHGDGKAWQARLDRLTERAS